MEPLFWGVTVASSQGWVWKLLGEVGSLLGWLLPGKGTESDEQGERDGVRSGGMIWQSCV